MKKLFLLVSFLVGINHAVATSEGPFSQELGVRVLEFTGMLEPAYAIGGETTGLAMRTEIGRFIELKGKNRSTTERLKVLATNRSTATLKGYFILVRGVEIPERKVFKVLTIKTDG